MTSNLPREGRSLRHLFRGSLDLQVWDEHGYLGHFILPVDAADIDCDLEGKLRVRISVRDVPKKRAKQKRAKRAKHARKKA